MMSAKFRTIKGVQDILPPRTCLWQRVEDAAKRIFSLYGFSEIRTPIIEFTELFVRSIGEDTDIVEKEMYTFHDRAGRSITLRPEGTASVVRAFIQNNLYNLPAPQKFYYCGPMFRYERPQKGRYRQFHQIGVEAFSIDDPYLEAELIEMLWLLLEELGMENLNTEVNSIGCPECRPDYKKKLLNYLEGNLGSLCADCKRRYRHNPLRVFDCKFPNCKEIITGAPKITEFLCENCGDHFKRFLSYLKKLDIPYSINPSMVRGLDYYTRTVFEITTTSLGAQNAVAAGGRYDTLVEEFGGPRTPAAGFAIGMERLITLLEEKPFEPPKPDVYIISLGEDATDVAYTIASSLRREGLQAELSYGTGSLKSQLRRADRFNASLALIIGEDELKRGTLTCKRLSDGFQGEIKMTGLVSDIKRYLNHDQDT